ncbi:hypothetical protein HCJ93_07055 [Streptomyces sp. SBST2-5]|uniref:Ig-like domain-containing protein n=1 Tax=Streptomyces composti TaxID=2720025 RepID=A0ABX1A0D5_9ACTN|nr:hypothetical protein [Streptomyces composti]NJP49835.1 hypothetical protein [Streptomyces composti]
MTDPEELGRPSGPAPAPESEEYSATVLASHWVQRPGPDAETAAMTATGREDDRRPGARDTVRDTGAGTGSAVRDATGAGTVGTVRDATGAGARDAKRDDSTGPGARGTLRHNDGGPGAHSVRPDRIEGTVLRFGPGVQAALARRSHAPATPASRATAHVTLPIATEPLRRVRRRGLRRHALPVLAVIAALAFLAWQRLGPGPALRQVTVTADPGTVACDGTADLVATVTTDGRPGTLTYRWIRSDGTSSGMLREDLARGQTRARLHLLWTFEGKGRYQAHAELRFVSPAGPSARTELTYDCP